MVLTKQYRVLAKKARCPERYSRGPGRVSPGFRQLPGGSDKKSCGSPPRTTPFQYETSVLNREYRKTIDDVQMTWGMRKLPPTAAEDLLEIVMRRYERTSTLLTSNRPIEDWGKLLGDTAAVTAMLDRLLHHGHILKCGPRSWRTKTQLPADETNEK